MTLKEKVLKLLGERGPLTLKELHDLLPEHTYHGMCGTVYRYVYQGVVVRVGKGKYAVAKEVNKRTGRKAKSGRPAKSTKNPRSNRRTSKPKAAKAMSAEAALADALCRFADGFGLALTASGGETWFVFDILRWAGIKNTKEVREAIRFTATPSSRYVYAFFEDSDFTVATLGLKPRESNCELIRV